MSIDAQRYRQASMAWLRVSDLLLLTPGWKRSEGCRAERIAALKLCPHCGGTGWEPNSSPPECSVCEGMRVVPALTDRQAQILAQETLALIRMHRESADGDS